MLKILSSLLLSIIATHFSFSQEYPKLDKIDFKPKGDINASEFHSKNQTPVYKNTPLYVVNGKISSHAAVLKINSKTIDSISVLKGKKATIKYNDKATNGVIEIFTKQL